jgi:hypothetical protein
MIPVFPAEAVAGGLQLAFGFLTAVAVLLQYMFFARG